MSDPYASQRIPPPRGPKPPKFRDPGGTSIGNLDQAGLDAVGTSRQTASQLFVPSPNPLATPSRSLAGDTSPGEDTSRHALQRRPANGSVTPSYGSGPGESVRQWQDSQRDQDHNPPPEQYPTDMRTPTGTPATTSLASLEQRRERHDIIYRLELNDPQFRATTFRYDLERFKGLDRNDNAARRDLAVMDLSSSVSGFWSNPSSRRSNQLRDSFLEDPDRTPFVIGRDFIARSHTFYSIRIHSSRVLDVLRSLIKYYPSLGLQLEDTEVFFMWPYRVLVYYFDELLEIQDQCVLDTSGEELEIHHGTTRLDRQTHKDLTVVLGYLKPIYVKEIQPELDLHQRGLARFSTLWLLFKPGSTVFAKVKGQLMFFKVLSANREIDSGGESSGPWSIVVWGLYFDGYLLKRQARRFKMYEFHGEREIQKLPIKPIEYLQSPDGTKEQLIERGRLYHNFVCEVPLYRKYSGPVNGDRGDHYVGDVIIDPAGYTKESSSAKQVPTNFEVMFGARGGPEDDFGNVLGEPPDFGGGPYTKLNDRECSKSTPLEDDEEYLLLPGHIQGYALGRKQWLAFDLISFPDKNSADRPWENLVMEPADLEMVQSIAGKHRGSNILPWTEDFIPGKGQGQVVMLHGPPGVGKTLSVECIATQMGRPLLSLTIADIGTAEDSAEANLAKYLRLATKWGAIVLIDEAETFLTRRVGGDYKRNSIVTAFLRALEYYSGMIFLTTNEPGRIDSAVSSRIHLAIEYQKLKKDKRRLIWLAHIRQMQKQQNAPSWPKEVPKVQIDEMTQTFITSESGIEDIENLNMSGRDIRNAFQTAVKLARFDSDRKARLEDREPDKVIMMEPEHFKKAMQTKFNLRKVMKSIHGLTEEQMAHEDGASRDMTAC